MPHVLLISGSPTAASRSAALLDRVSRAIEGRGLTTRTVGVRDFPAEDLVLARYDSPAFEEFKALIADAAGLVVATPIYKASYAGGLKALLDILPPGSLRGKTVLPIATGGSLAHLLAIDYALKPVLAVLGASDIQQGVYGVDSQFRQEDGAYVLEAELQARLDDSVERLVEVVETLNSHAVA